MNHFHGPRMLRVGLYRDWPWPLQHVVDAGRAAGAAGTPAKWRPVHVICTRSSGYRVVTGQTDNAAPAHLFQPL